MFQLSKLIAGLIRGTNLDYVVIEKDLIKNTNLKITKDEESIILNELEIKSGNERNVLTKRTKNIIKKKFVYSVQYEDIKIYIFSNQKGFSEITLYGCVKLLAEKIEPNEYKNYYFYKEL